MSEVTCAHCGTGLPGSKLSPQRTFCSAGCDLIGHIPTDAEGNFPINGALGHLLLLGLSLFNQVLAAVGATAFQNSHPFWSTRFAWASAALGGVTFIYLGVLQWRSAQHRLREATLFLLLALTHLASWRGGYPRLWESLAVNALYAAWAFRGVIRARFWNGKR